MSPEHAPAPRRPGLLSWVALTVLSVLVTALLWFFHVPGSLLIGPMCVAICFGLAGTGQRVDRKLFAGGQAIIGCMAASAITPQTFASLMDHWLLYLGVALAILFVSLVIGWVGALRSPLPGSTFVWGSAPGGASVMVVMSTAFDADPRLVAVMQYLRVILVTAGASLMVSLWGSVSAGSGGFSVEWFPAVRPVPFASLVGVVIVGAALGRLLRLPGAFLLGPFFVCIAANLLGIDLQIPEWLIALGCALIGWAVGLDFRRETISLAWKAMPHILLSTVLLLLFCFGTAYWLHVQYGIHLLTAFLATSPGGLDSMVIIAAGTRGVDVSLVVTIQTLRLLVVMLLGPFLAGRISRRLRAKG